MGRTGACLGIREYSKTAPPLSPHKCTGDLQRRLWTHTILGEDGKELLWRGGGSEDGRFGRRCYVYGLQGTARRFADNHAGLLQWFVKSPAAARAGPRGGLLVPAAPLCLAVEPGYQPQGYSVAICSMWSLSSLYCSARERKRHSAEIRHAARMQWSRQGLCPGQQASKLNQPGPRKQGKATLP